MRSQTEFGNERLISFREMKKYFTAKTQSLKDFKCELFSLRVFEPLRY